MSEPSASRTRLLVSVFSPDEVEAAVSGGAEVIDVKNPLEGALGAPTIETLRAVRDGVRPPLEVSAALGDAPHLPGTMAFAALGAASLRPDYLKIGLLGSRCADEAVELLLAVKRAALGVSPGIRVVAVAYADASVHSSLLPEDLPEVACRAGVHGVMLDTLSKNGSSTLSLLGEERLLAFLARAQGLGLITALAGQLRAEDFPRLGALGFSLVGVRGSACDGGRMGKVSAARVRGLRFALSSGSRGTPLLGADARAVPGAVR